MKPNKDHPDLFHLKPQSMSAREGLARWWKWLNRPVVWASTFAGVGMIAGIVIGYNIAQPVPPEPVDTAVNRPPVPMPQASVEDDIEYDVPVRVDRSERALERYQYEEKIAPTIDEATTSEDADPIDELVANLNKTDTETVTGSDQKTEAKPPRSLEKQPFSNSSGYDGAWRAEAIATPGLEAETRPMIAIVIDDVGIDQKRSRRSIDLKAPLTLSFIPYGYNLEKLVGIARKNGHEVMLHMPMEPTSEHVDPGPNALLTSLSEAELTKRIDWDLKQFEGYIGINNHMGSKFTAWEPGMRLVMRKMKARGLIFLDSITSSESVAYKVAREMNVPVARRDVFLDHEQDEKQIAIQLRRTERIARNNGYAIAIGHPHDETTDVLKKWIPDVKTRGFRLVPVSAIIQRKQAVYLAQEKQQDTVAN